jgi:hypothetical protein
MRERHSFSFYTATLSFIPRPPGKEQVPGVFDNLLLHPWNATRLSVVIDYMPGAREKAFVQRALFIIILLLGP